MADTKVGVLGAGRFGSHLIHGLRSLGLSVSVLTREGDRTAWVAGNQVLCLACRDDQLTQVAADLATESLDGKLVLIHSGATPLSLLAPLVDKGAQVGKFHPLMAFTRVRDAPIPPGTPFAIEGPIETRVRPWVHAWGCKCHVLSGDQWHRYHLAAVLAANFLPLFIRAGAEILRPLAESEADALDWLAPLVRQTLEGALDGENRLPYSGPAVRGDREVIAAHVALLEQHLPEMKGLYREASKEIQKRALFS